LSLKKQNGPAGGDRDMIEVRFHGRGGQGAVTSAELIAHAAIEEGRFAQSFPSFGPERRGAPVVAFVRIDDQRIRTRAEISDPDVVVVLDSGLLCITNVCMGLNPEGTSVLNTGHKPADISTPYALHGRIATVDANKIAREVLGITITNTTMLGALIKATGLVKIESMANPMKHRFGRLADKNTAALQRAYEETTIWEAKN
jgi:pyruvate ferredoxin oxidoreductase gamma subunit